MVFQLDAFLGFGQDLNQMNREDKATILPTAW